MRIVIDMQSMQTESRYRGIGRYSMALTQAIVRNAEQHEIFIVINNSRPETVEEICNSLKDVVTLDRVIVFEVPQLVSWENSSNAWRRRAAELIRGSFIAELEPDIVHITSLFEGAMYCDAVTSTDLFCLDAKIAVTLYDLIPLLNPKDYLGSDWTKAWYADKIKNLKRADVLLAISESSRQEAITSLDINASHIVNISSAHTKIFKPYADDQGSKEDIFSRFGIKKPYLIYSGALESRKNLDGLLRAFALLPLPLRIAHQLVFAGKISEYEHQRIAHFSKSLGIEEDLILTGYIADDDLVALFNYCTLFIFPSLHEGFGLPALEAMACGAPTIGSNTTSIPEVIGRADALFDPKSPEDIAKKISEVISNEGFLQSLREHALIQASKFSWDITAKRVISAFEKIHSKKLANKFLSWSEISERRNRIYKEMIESIAQISHEPIGPSDIDLFNIARSIASNRIKTDRVMRFQRLPEKIAWRIEGPFDSTYSLALLNRETARALDALGHYVVMHSTEGPGDFPANTEFLKVNPDIEVLYGRSLNIPTFEYDVTSRNLYPPRVNDMDCRLNLLHHYAWEESGFPAEWVVNFNEYLQGITCLSKHVEKILIDNGVGLPIAVSGCGVDHWLRIKPSQNYQVTCKSFRFLHVSSCFPRKGADILLNAYGKAFTSRDDVTLIIKTFPNPHNEIHKWLAEARLEFLEFPDVLVIEEDLSESELKSLYEQCNSLVAPSRAEGFGLPLAEAMLSDLAVITTAWGGQLDFCNPATAWLVDYKFAYAKSHFCLFDSVWAEPDTFHLSELMYEVYKTPLHLLRERSDAGKSLLLEKFKWVDTANRLINSARSWAEAPHLNNPRIGWISSWNARCGIASYSANLVANIPSNITVFAPRTKDLTRLDSAEVIRCWSAGEDDSLKELTSCIDDQNIDTLIIQFNYVFFNLENFGIFLTHQLDAGRSVIIFMHSTMDPIHVLPHKRLELIYEPLSRCHRILVHTPSDLNRLKLLGLIDNVALFPHGIQDYYLSQQHQSETLPATKKNQLTIASYGFFLPHKGLLELVEAIALLKSQGVNVRLIMVNAEYPIPDSRLFVEHVKQKILELRLVDKVQMHTDFLADEESLGLLSHADLIVFPYQETGESSSAAVRSALATGRPVAVTPLSIFDDVAPAVFQLPGMSPSEMAQGILDISKAMTENTISYKKKISNSSQWRDAHRFSILGSRLCGMLKNL